MKTIYQADNGKLFDIAADAQREDEIIKLGETYEKNEFFATSSGPVEWGELVDWARQNCALMSKFALGNINIDPTGYYASRIHPEDIRARYIAITNVAGILPIWLTNPLYVDDPAQEAIEGQYMFGGWNPSKDADIKFDKKLGTYEYPGDPIAYPLIKIRRRKDVCYIYPFDVISIYNRDTEKFELARID